MFDSLLNYFSNQNTNATNLRIAQEQRAWQQQENERVHQRNIEMWNMENDYNSPKAQMERLNAAGLSPMLAYSSGNVGGMSSSSSPKLDATQSQMPTLQPFTGWNLKASSVVDMINAWKNFKLINEDIKGKQLDNQAKHYSNQLLREQITGHKFTNWFNETTKQHQIESLVYGNNEKLARTRNYDSNSLFANSKTALNNQALDYNKEDRSYKLQMLKNRVSIEELEKFQKQLDYQFGLATYDARIGIVSLDRALKSANVRLTNRQAMKVQNEIYRLIEDNDFNKYQHNVKKILGNDWKLDPANLLQQFMYQFFKQLNYF